MSEPTQIVTRLPQNDDSVALLLARLLAVQSQRVTGTALVLLARTQTTQTGIIDTQGFRYLVLFHRITAVPGVESVTLNLLMIDPVSGVSNNPLNGSPRTVASLFITSVGPGLGVNLPLPDQIRLEVLHSGTGSFTYSVGYCLIP